MNDAKVTVGTLTSELDEARAVAKHCSQPNAMVAATMGKAKLLGLITDKSEVKHGDIDSASPEQIKAMVEALGISYSEFCKLFGVAPAESAPFSADPDKMQASWAQATAELVDRDDSADAPAPTHLPPEREQ
jgi:hypothetical protein